MEKKQNKNNTDTIQRSHRYFFFQNTAKITYKKSDTKYTRIIQGSYSKTVEVKTFACIMSHF